MVGGLVAIAATAVAWWRSTRRPGAATTFKRAFTLTGDERDDEPGQLELVWRATLN